MAEALPKNELELEGEKITVIEIGPGEADVSSALYIPSIKTIVTGDQIFSRVHGWLVEYRPEGSLEGIRRLRDAGPIDVVLPGHGPAGGPDLLDANERYIRDFMAAAESATTKDEGVAAMSTPTPTLSFRSPSTSECRPRSRGGRTRRSCGGSSVKAHERRSSQDVDCTAQVGRQSQVSSPKYPQSPATSADQEALGFAPSSECAAGVGAASTLLVGTSRIRTMLR